MLNNHQTRELFFNDFFHIDEIQKLQNLFSLSNGISSIILTKDGVPITDISGGKNYIDLLSINTDDENYYKVLNDSNQWINKCPNTDALYFSANIIVGTSFVGKWVIGGVLEEDDLGDVKSVDIDHFMNVCKYLLFHVGTITRMAFDNFKSNQNIEKFINSEKILLNEIEQFKVTISSIGDGVITTDKLGNISFMNKMSETITGWNFNEVKGLPIIDILILFDIRTKARPQNHIKNVLETGKIVSKNKTYVLHCKNGEEKYVSDSVAPIKSKNGCIEGVVVVMRDETENVTRNEKITYLSYHDTLTGLYNRRFFDEQLKRLNVERNLPLSIIIGDVNGLKLTNDAFGHDMGDLLLQKMAEKIKEACRKDDIIARFGGDEFIILLPKTSTILTKRIAQRIVYMCKEVQLKGVNFSISVGYSSKQKKSTNIKNIIKIAEDDMYRIKSLEEASTRIETINTILKTFHERNPKEKKHSQGVSDLCIELGKNVGLTGDELDELKLLGLMHDIGKVAIEANTLGKNDQLSTKEWSNIMRHPEVGYRILRTSSKLSKIADYILKEHERIDGKGYPSGLSNEEIPLQSKILAIADAFDSMTNKNNYKRKLTKLEALEELQKESGKHFDPELVEIFVSKVIEI